ncbi:MAG: tripartite tricarboxylate transporter substrate binding protein, partial [Burkholderiales bacterium]|nr:tripartite tricarboxylate transporter substrate binding protein [Burkholderiales bacterium]
APAKTPVAIVNRLNDELRKGMASDEATSVIIANGAVPELQMLPEQFNALLTSEIAAWRKIVQERNIKAD